MLTYTLASALVATAIRLAQARGLGIAVVVVDNAGHPIALARMDGVNFLTGRIATGKAHAAALLGRPTAATQERAAAAPQLYHTLAELSGAPMVHVPGGVPIEREGQILGAVGISGGTPDQDRELAELALAHVRASAQA
ncbi:MAG: heme-binding protein [Chloroflexi bacterium]|nr:heme-binding protein [Chloroflexota bacterium]